MKYRFHRTATAEHYDNVNFYEDRLPGLGADYLKEFESVMAHICSAPNFYPTIGAPGIHKAGLKRFPFFVIYRAEQNQIVVLAVAHQRRQPAYWSGRVAKR
jgi:plasmid stabilization system protein ParE